MTIKKYVSIGQFIKSHGLTGLMRVSLKPSMEVILKDLDCIFIREEGQMLPLFIEYVELIGQDYAFKLEDIDQPQDASQLGAREIFADQSWLSALPAYQPHEKAIGLVPHDLIGYSIHDKNLKEPLIVEDIQEFPQQIMAFVNKDDREIILPLNDSFISRIDHKNKEIFTEYPSGIFDL